MLRTKFISAETLPEFILPAVGDVWVRTTKGKDMKVWVSFIYEIKHIVKNDEIWVRYVSFDADGMKNVEEVVHAVHQRMEDAKETHQQWIKNKREVKQGLFLKSHVRVFTNGKV